MTESRGLEERVIEDNGRIKLVEIEDPEIATKSLLENNTYKEPILVYLPNGSSYTRVLGSSFGERKDSIQPPSINKCLDYTLSYFREWVSIYERWDSGLRERGVSEFDYLSGVKNYEIEGNFEEGASGHIEPRFLRFDGINLGEIHMAPVVLTGMSKELRRPIARNFATWLALSTGTSFWNGICSKGRLNDHLEDIRRGEWDDSQRYAGEDYGIEGWRGMVADALVNHYDFLRGCYSDTKKFIESIEEYRS